MINKEQFVIILMKHYISNFSQNKKNKRKQSVLSLKEISPKQDSELPIVVTSPFRVRSKAELNRSPRYPKSCYSISYLYQDKQKHSSTSSINQKSFGAKASLDFRTRYAGPSISSTNSHYAYQTPNIDIFSNPIKTKKNLNIDSPNSGSIEDASERDSKWLRYNEVLEFNEKDSFNSGSDENLEKIKKNNSNKVSKLHLKSSEISKKPDKGLQRLQKSEKNKRNKRVSLLYADYAGGQNDNIDCKLFPGSGIERVGALKTGIKGIGNNEKNEVQNLTHEIESSERSTERLDHSLSKDSESRPDACRDVQDFGKSFGRLTEKNHKRLRGQLRKELKEVEIFDCEKGFESTDLDQIKSSDSLKYQELEELCTQNTIPAKSYLNSLKSPKNFFSSSRNPNSTQSTPQLNSRLSPKPSDPKFNSHPHKSRLGSRTKLFPFPNSPTQALSQASANAKLPSQVPGQSGPPKRSPDINPEEKTQNPGSKSSAAQANPQPSLNPNPNPNQANEIISNPSKPEGLLHSKSLKQPLDSAQAAELPDASLCSPLSRQSTKPIQFCSPNEKAKLLRQLHIRQAGRLDAKLKHNQTIKTSKASQLVKPLKGSQSFENDSEEGSSRSEDLAKAENGLGGPVDRFVMNYSSSLLGTLQVMILDLQESLKGLTADGRTVDLEKVSEFFDGFCKVDVKRRNAVIGRSLKQALRGISKELYRSVGRVKASGLALMIKGVRDSVLSHRAKTGMIKYLQEPQQSDPEKIAEQLKDILSQSLDGRPWPAAATDNELDPQPEASFRLHQAEDRSDQLLPNPSQGRQGLQGLQVFSSDAQSPRPPPSPSNTLESYLLNLSEDGGHQCELNSLDLGKSFNQFYFSSKIDHKYLPDPDFSHLNDLDFEFSDDLDIVNLSSYLQKIRFLALKGPEAAFDGSDYQLIVQELQELDPCQQFESELKRIQLYLKRIGQSKTRSSQAKESQQAKCQTSKA